MTPIRAVSDAGLAFLKREEGFRAQRYICPTGHPTIGHGHQIMPGETLPSVLTLDQAHDLLVKDTVERGGAVLADVIPASVIAGLPQGVWDAMVSWAFNNKPSAVKASTLVRMVNAGDLRAAADQLMRWDKGVVDGRLVRIGGLTKRRARERVMWITALEEE